MYCRFKLIATIYMLAMLNIANGQNRAPRFFSEKKLEPKLDSMKTNFGLNKILPKKYELASLVALSYYPELKFTPINFVVKKLNSTMAARPAGLQFLRPKGKRKYKVLLNNINPEVPLDSASFNAKIGIIGHEFAHIVDYESKSTVRLICNAFGYANKNFRAKFERSTDQRTINHGLFWQCFDFSTYVFKYHKANPKYLEYKRKYYMAPEEIIHQK